MNLTLDSRNRIDPTAPNTCKFLMQDAVIANRFELATFQFANFLYNVTSSTNKLYISGSLAVTITPGFWDVTDFITELNDQLMTFFSTGTDVVVIDANT